MEEKNILWLNEISKKDIALVGGKNASLGELMTKLKDKGINIPQGFAITANAYRFYLKANGLEKTLKEVLGKLGSKNIKNVQEVGRAARQLILKGVFPKELKEEIILNYRKLSSLYQEKNTDVAVRSSGTAEDLADASFAGQMETYLNVKGEEKLLETVKRCFASLFTERAIAYREEKGFDHLKIALSVGVQKMVRSDLASSGVMFTLDTETGFDKVVLINAIWGVGEMIVQGKITPDEFYVFKPTLKQGFKSIIIKNLGRKNKKYIYSNKGGLKEVKIPLKKQKEFSLNDEEVLKLAQWGCLIEEHYGTAQDIEWAKDGKTGELFIVQARPETVHSSKAKNEYEEYEIEVKEKPILLGIAVGNKIGFGKAKIISSVSQLQNFEKGEVLVTKMTDPDWVPAMRLASAIITDEGGKTAHAAIVSRELGIPCIVGTQNATQILKNGEMVTVDCTQSQGRVFRGKVPFKVKKYNLQNLPKINTKLMVNIGAPEIAFKTSFLPHQGVGLAREEFIIAEKIQIHPLALYHFDELKKLALKDKKIKEVVAKIEKVSNFVLDKKEFFINKLAEGISQIAAAFWPHEVIVRFSDFRTNEYRNLIGGFLYEGEEANPMLGWRGAARYLDKDYQPAFLMEIEAIKKVRNVFGLKNISLLIPFCRTLEEAKGVSEILVKTGLISAIFAKDRFEDDLKVYVMAEIPSNVILADQFLDYFDGMSIGSNDLTQLTLGLDRDNAKIAKVGDERNEAVKELIKKVIAVCHQRKKYSGICGEAPSYFLDFAQFLIKEGIQSISLNPDSLLKTLLHLGSQNFNEEKPQN